MFLVSGKLWLWVSWLIILTSALPASTQAEKVYIYHNAHGKMLFSDLPSASPGYRLQRIRYFGKPPAWRSCQGLSPAKLARRARAYSSMIETIATRHGVSAQLVQAVIVVESCFDPHAVSSAGARGLMQLMPAITKLFGVHDPFVPYANLNAGTAYLKRLIDRYHGNLRLALAAYNAGPGAVHKYGGIPPYPETRHFVRQVLAARYRG